MMHRTPLLSQAVSLAKYFRPRSMLDNKILVFDEKDCWEVTEFPGLSVTFKGRNAVVKIHHSVTMNKVHLFLNDEDYVIINQKTLMDVVRVRFEKAKRTTLVIGKECSVRGVRIYAGREYGLEAIIGNDVLFAKGSTLRLSDTHTLLSEDNEILNMPKFGVHIGNHVWTGQDALLLKDSIVPDGCIVAARAVVTRQTNSDPNSIIGGCPAKTLKKNIRWEH